MTLDAATMMIRTELDKGRDSIAQRSKRENNQRLEALVPALGDKVPVILQANSLDEIHQAMRIASDYKLRLIVSGGVAAYQLAPELASRHIGVILGNSGGEGNEYSRIRGGGKDYSDRGPAILVQAGVPVSFFGAVPSGRVMFTGKLAGEPALNAAWGFRNGATEEQALRMVTLTPAEMFGFADHVGSLDVGKMLSSS